MLSTDGRQVRIAVVGGGGGQVLLKIDSRIESARLSGDGTTMVITIDRDGTIVGTTTRIQRGIYVMSSNGSGLKQIVSPAHIAALIPGATADAIFPLGASPTALSISRDGGRIVFGAGGWGLPYSGHLFTVRSDGGGLTVLMSKLKYVTHGHINGNGATLAYQVVPDDGTDTGVLGVMNVDGSKPLTLTTGNYSVGSRFGVGEPWTISHDGSQLFIGSYGLLFRTDGSDVVSLGARGVFYGEPPGSRRLFGDPGGVIYRATMDALGTRFLYLSADTKAVLQLVVLHLNPRDSQPVLSVDSATITPSIVRNGPGATLSARVSGAPGLVGYVVLRQGTVQDYGGLSSDVLHDDGTNGDASAGDGMFTYNNVRAGSTATPGSRTVRVHAEGRDASGRRVAHAVEIEPFSVIDPALAPVTQSIGPSGGEVSVAGGSGQAGGATVSVPAGTFATSTGLTVTLANEPPTGVVVNGGRLLPKTIEVTTSSGTNLLRTVEIRINLPAVERTGLDITAIKGGVVVNRVVEPRPTRVIDADRGVLGVTVDHFTKFTLFTTIKPGPALTAPAAFAVLPALTATLAWDAPLSCTCRSPRLTVMGPA